MTGYVHGYATPEQQRLVVQAEHWRERLIRSGTELEPGTKLLEIGCGAGAVLAVLGQEFPGVELTGVDIEPAQIEFAHGHLEAAGLSANLVQADALALPFEHASFDHVWMMWFLEHLKDPVAALREARRVLRAGGLLTAIEVDYGTCRAEPASPEIDALFAATVRALAAAGASDAGSRLTEWFAAAGFDVVDEGARPFWWQGAELTDEAAYAADVIESALPALVEQRLSEPEARAGLAALRALPTRPEAGLGWVVHKTMGRT